MARAVPVPCVLTTGELANYLGVARRSVSDWCDEGLIRCHRIPGKNHERRIQLRDALAFALSKRLPSEALEDLAIEHGVALARFPSLLLVSPSPGWYPLSTLDRFNLGVVFNELAAVAASSFRRYKAILLDGALGRESVAKALDWLVAHTDSSVAVLACEDEWSDWILRGARWQWQHPADWAQIAGTLAVDLMLAPAPIRATPPAPLRKWVRCPQMSAGVRAMEGHGAKFTRKQEQALAALLAHATLSEAAKVAKVSDRTLRRWLKLPQFASAWNTVRSGFLLDTVSQLQEASTQAVATLKRNLSCGEAGTEVRAADVLLSQTLKGTEALDLKRRVEDLEQRARDAGLERAA
jgi:excisionase family DNA binding protein